jgi:pimeloyl-ACP methyl ester carboxylesterase
MRSTSDITVSRTGVSAYCPFPLTKNDHQLRLTTSEIPTSLGTVTVRHGRSRGPVATILLHGAAGSWTTWTPFIRAADEQSAAGPIDDLVIPDLPGWGDTPLPDDAAAETIESLAVAVVEITRALGYERWQVIGHSLGGFVALELAARYPAETSHVGLVSATTYTVIESARHPLARFGLLPGFTALLGVMRMLARLGGGRSFVAGLHRLGMLRALTAPLFARSRGIDSSVVAALATEARPLSFALAAKRAARYDADLSWARIACPVRAVHGARDVFVTDSDDVRMAAVIADFSVAVLAGTGHFAHIERPAETVRAVQRAATRGRHDVWVPRIS